MRANWQEKRKRKSGALRKGHSWPLRAIVRRKKLCVLQIIIVYVVLGVSVCLMND